MASAFCWRFQHQLSFRTGRYRRKVLPVAAAAREDLRLISVRPQPGAESQGSQTEASRGSHDANSAEDSRWLHVVVTHQVREEQWLHPRPEEEHLSPSQAETEMAWSSITDEPAWAQGLTRSLSRSQRGQAQRERYRYARVRSAWMTSDDGHVAARACQS